MGRGWRVVLAGAVFAVLLPVSPVVAQDDEEISSRGLILGAATVDRGERASISGDGAWVAFNDGDGIGVLLWSARTNITREVDPNGFLPSISDDGRWVAYSKFTDSVFDVFLWDRDTDISANLSASTEVSMHVEISDDGAVVVWRDIGERGPGVVRVWQRSTGRVEQRSLDGFGLPILSGSGRYVVFNPRRADRAVRWDLQTGREAALPYLGGYHSISDDGNDLVFYDGAVLGVLDIASGRRSTIPVPIEEDLFGVYRPVISGDGATVFFSTSQSLSSSDTNQTSDAYQWRIESRPVQLAGPKDRILSVSDDGSRGVGFGATGADHFYRMFEFGKDFGPLVSWATTLNEILAASDYKKDDADLLRLYQAFFSRQPDAAGAVYWIDVSRRGYSLEQIAEFFTAVPEYSNLYTDTTNEEFLTAVYANVLGRRYDQAGFDYWLKTMDEGLSRGGVVRWVTASPEFRNRHPFEPNNP